jgi:hypothetical protein
MRLNEIILIGHCFLQNFGLGYQPSIESGFTFTHPSNPAQWSANNFLNSNFFGHQFEFFLLSFM